MDSPIQQIKDRLDIVEVVSGYLKLEKTGINLRACCPFHGEKKPSFFVSPARQSFKCFGCGESGSIFDFVMKIEGIEFGDALRILAKKAGVELKSYRANPQLQTQRTHLYEINEIACRFFEKQLKETSTGKKAIDYLTQRGLTKETIEKFRLGFSPNQWRVLSDFLVGRGYKREEVLSAGLTVASEKVDTPYDRFRGRIMFPIFDGQSQVIGFGARVFMEDKIAEKAEVKYINTPATMLYDKGNSIYGLNFGKMEIRKNDSCILTEGYMDVILSHQAGFENTVASSGTALTQNQLKILKRYTTNLLTAFDMDTAGNTATERGIDMALSEDFQVKVITMPQGKDPADVILENHDDWQKMVENSKNIMDFYFESAISKLDKQNPQSKKEIADNLLLKIKKLSNKILQSHWIQKLSQEINIKEDILFEELKKLTSKDTLSNKPQATGQPQQKSNNNIKNRQALLEEKIISLALKAPEYLKDLTDDCLAIFSEQTKTILTSLKAQGDGQVNLEKISSCLDDECKLILENCAFKAEFEEDTPEEMLLCLAELKGIDKKNTMSSIAQAIGQAEKLENKEETQTLLSKFNDLAHTRNI